MITELRAFHAPSCGRGLGQELGSKFRSRLWLRGCWAAQASQHSLLSQVECNASFVMHMLMHSLDNVSLHLRPKGSVTNPRFDKTKTLIREKESLYISGSAKFQIFSNFPAAGICLGSSVASPHRNVTTMLQFSDFCFNSPMTRL